MVELSSRIETERLTLRHLTHGDAEQWAAAIDASLDSLLQFMPWAHNEPQPMSARLALIDLWSQGFRDGIESQLGIFSNVQFLGGTGLSTRRGHSVLEIGYWIHNDHRLQGFAAEACRGQIAAAFEVDGIDQRWVIER